MTLEEYLRAAFRSRPKAKTARTAAAPEDGKPKTGAEIVARWQGEGLLRGFRNPDKDASEVAYALRASYERREQPE